jgi:protein Mpv17
MSFFYKGFKKFSARRPILVLSVTNGFLGLVADFSAQTISPSDKGFDKERTARFIGYQSFFTPVFYYWYSFLNKKFPLPAATRSLTLVKPVLKRVLFDQAIFAPIGLANFFIIMGKLEGKTFTDIKEKFNRNYFTALISNYALWPASQFINFSLIPLYYQVPFASCVGIAWNTYLSWLNNKDHQQPIKQQHQVQILPQTPTPLST